MKIKFRDLEVEYRGKRKAMEPDLFRGKRVWRYHVRVTKGNQSKLFFFYDSVENYEAGKVATLLEALENILLEACYAIFIYSMDEMAKELNITEPSDAIRLWRRINRTVKKLKELGLSEEEILSYYVEISENSIMELEMAKKEVMEEIRNLEAKS